MLYQVGLDGRNDSRQIRWGNHGFFMTARLNRERDLLFVLHRTTIRSSLGRNISIRLRLESRHEMEQRSKIACQLHFLAPPVGQFVGAPRRYAAHLQRRQQPHVRHLIRVGFG
jgi:hypothetical protein